MVLSSGNWSEKRGFAIAKRLRNWSFSRKIPVVEQPKCGTKNIPRIFRRNQTSSGLPPVNSCFCSHPLSKSQFPAQEESDKQNIHLYFTFSYNSQQWSSQNPLSYFCLSKGLNMSNQSGLLCTSLPSQSILSHWTIEYIYVATCDSPYFQDLSLYTCSLKARIGFQHFRVGSRFNQSTEISGLPWHWQRYRQVQGLTRYTHS